MSTVTMMPPMTMHVDPDTGFILELVITRGSCKMVCTKTNKQYELKPNTVLYEKHIGKPFEITDYHDYLTNCIYANDVLRKQLGDDEEGCSVCKHKNVCVVVLMVHEVFVCTNCQTYWYENASDDVDNAV